MPNNTSCLLHIEGDINQINKLISEVSDGDCIFSFNKIVPMPESLNVSSGTKSNSDLDSYKWTIGDKEPLTEIYNNLSKSSRLSKNKKSDITLEEFANEQVALADLKNGKQVYENIKNYGHATWYEWCNDNWGTKWQAYNLSEEWLVGDKEAEIDFCTAWSPPIPIIEQLSFNYPDLKFKMKFADEGKNFLGYVVFEKCKLIEDVEIEDWTSEEGISCLEGLLYADYE